MTYGANSLVDIYQPSVDPESADGGPYRNNFGDEVDDNTVGGLGTRRVERAPCSLSSTSRRVFNPNTGRSSTIEQTNARFSLRLSIESEIVKGWKLQDVNTDKVFVVEDVVSAPVIAGVRSPVTRLVCSTVS